MRKFAPDLRSRVGRTSASFALGALVTVAACTSDSATNPSLSPAQRYWALVLNEHAVTLAAMAPYDTIRLKPVARNSAGQAIASVGPVSYSVSDSIVTVDSAGLVRARYETLTRGTPTYVIATMQDTARHLTLADTVFIQVTSTAPASPMASLSIQPDPSDSAIRGIDLAASIATLHPQVLDANGAPMSAVLVAFSTSDSTIGYATRRSTSDLTNPGGDIYGQIQGTVTFYATAWAYGVEKRDSVVYTLTLPRSVSVEVDTKTPAGSLTPVLYFIPTTQIIGVGGVVTWENFLPDSIDVVFDDPAAVDSAAPFNDPEPYFPYTGRGNIAAIFYDEAAIDNGDYDTYFREVRAARAFPVAGTYHYHSALYGTSGKIIVR